MIMFALRTVLKMAITLFVIITLVFFATRLSGNPIDIVVGEGLTQEDRALLTAYFGLDAPVWEQYLRYLRSILEGEFGISFLERRPVSQIVAERIGPSLQLLGSSLALTLAVAVPLGIAAALYRKSWIGSAVMIVAFLGYAVPNFVLAIFMILIFAFTLNWLPVVGNGSPWHFVMPTIAMSGVLIAALTRFTRNAMLDVLGQDYMRTARAKGLPEHVVIFKHGLKNAGVTILSVLGLQIAGMAASGNVVVEAIFSWPGIGDLLVRSAIMRDYPVLQFGVISVALAVVVINAVVDIAYAWADPRIRLAGG
ncbi:MAG: ABC transporter permease [Confluentimicrobium sp.]|jgi:ABC-type dipeptide/oligopeptide/nickel transport system permease component|uniref:ABC transporter permease n=1 Tax=Actibacterium sp. TaxID=1872125 RepID=UPI000C3FE4BB|nr:ABC transporter permease [Actibacterium sp.]MBC56868.1 ABC transporter permease [Actibacterium sp.]|tara:strand:- start:738 stop:1664 length:927 start_codon:yes stop_codon:yes gene_type:complete